MPPEAEATRFRLSAGVCFPIKAFRALSGDDALFLFKVSGPPFRLRPPS
jgi:hypothetical protein